MVSARSNLVCRLGVFRRASPCDFAVGFRAAVTIELPGITDFLNFVKIQIRDEQFILVAAGLLHDFSARIAKIALAVKFADFPGSFRANAVDGGDEIGVSDGMGGLLKFPQILRQTGDRGGGVVDNFRAVKTEDPRALRKMAIVTDVNADAGVTRLENGVACVSGGEIKFLPEARVTVGNVVLAVLAEVAAVSVNDRSGVEVDAGHLHFVNGNDKNHLVFFGQLLHERDGGPVGDALGQLIPAGLLFRAEVRAVEKLLKPQDLHFFLRGIGDQALVLGNHFFLDVRQRILFRRPLTLGLNQATTNHARHATPPEQSQAKSLLCARWRDKFSAAESAFPPASTIRWNEFSGLLPDCH